MRKTIRNGIDRRAVYKFRCIGGCNRIKSTYVYDRAKSGVCLTCSKKKANGSQDGLFVGMDTAKVGDSVEIVTEYKLEEGVVVDQKMVSIAGKPAGSVLGYDHPLVKRSIENLGKIIGAGRKPFVVGQDQS